MTPPPLVGNRRRVFISTHSIQACPSPVDTGVLSVYWESLEGQPESLGRTYLQPSHATRPPAGKGGSSSSKRESGSSSSCCFFPPKTARQWLLAPSAARLLAHDPPWAQRQQLPPRSARRLGRLASLLRPFVCRGLAWGVLWDSKRQPERTGGVGWGEEKQRGAGSTAPRQSSEFPSELGDESIFWALDLGGVSEAKPG